MPFRGELIVTKEHSVMYPVDLLKVTYFDVQPGQHSLIFADSVTSHQCEISATPKWSIQIVSVHIKNRWSLLSVAWASKCHRGRWWVAWDNAQQREILMDG